MGRQSAGHGLSTDERRCMGYLACMSELTFFWHDYETFGAVPRRDRPA